MSTEECEHDYDNVIRKGRARYHCPKCDEDISLVVAFMADTISDGDCTYSKVCLDCGQPAMVVVRPGSVQCNKCG